MTHNNQLQHLYSHLHPALRENSDNLNANVICDKVHKPDAFGQYVANILGEVKGEIKRKHHV